MRGVIAVDICVPRRVLPLLGLAGPEAKGKAVMFDCGVHPAHSGFDSLPYFDDVDPESIDLLLITHFHLDHCGATHRLGHRIVVGRTGRL